MIRNAQFSDQTIEAFCLVASESDNDKAYCVTRHRGGRIQCTCPHYQKNLRRRGKLCKHGMKAYRENLFEPV